MSTDIRIKDDPTVLVVIASALVCLFWALCMTLRTGCEGGLLFTIGGPEVWRVLMLVTGILQTWRVVVRLSERAPRLTERLTDAGVAFVGGLFWSFVSGVLLLSPLSFAPTGAMAAVLAAGLWLDFMLIDLPREGLRGIRAQERSGRRQIHA